ncbi:MAG: hypothetical protein V1846_00165 [Candidatus Komeilibacteria bacterium]
MESNNQKVLQIVLVVVIIVGLLTWWALYRLGIFSGPSQQRQVEIMKTLDKNNNDFIKLLQQNADFLTSSTTESATVPAATGNINTDLTTSTNQ